MLIKILFALIGLIAGGMFGLFGVYYLCVFIDYLNPPKPGAGMGSIGWVFTFVTVPLFAIIGFTYGIKLSSNKMKNDLDYRIIADELTGKTKLSLVEDQEITDVEKELNIRFESDYKRYVTTYGIGILGGSFIRIYAPWRIKNERTQWTKRITKFYFWNDKNLNKDQVLQSLIIGDTMGGDEIIFYANQYYVLPHSKTEIFSIGQSLNEAIEWLCSSGVLTEAFKERNFEPF